jgi:uncharacterized protein YabE (DUF348 family)
VKTTQVHLRLTPDEADLIDELAGDVLGRQAVASMLLSAAIQAVIENGRKISIPPALTVCTNPTGKPRYVLNETPPPQKKK